MVDLVGHVIDLSRNLLREGDMTCLTTRARGVLTCAQRLNVSEQLKLVKLTLLHYTLCHK